MEPSMREDLKAVVEAAINNPLIAEKIFEQAEFRDKKNLRLINRFWRDCTLEEWRSNSAAICIMFPQWFDKKSANRCLFAETFERMMEGRQRTGDWDWPAPFCIQEKPFRKVILSGGTFSIPPCGGRKLERSVAFVENEFKLFKFLDKYGSQLDFLRLESCEIPIEGMEWIVQKSCPQLKTFSFHLDTHGGTSLQPSGSKLQELSHRTPQVESKLTKLQIWRHIGYHSYLDNEAEAAINPEDILRTVPNLKSLKYDDGNMNLTESEYYFLYDLDEYLVEFPITKALCCPLANGKYLELEELDIQMFVFNQWNGNSLYQELILGLSRYIELMRPSSFKKFRIELDFDDTSIPIESFSIEYPILNQFFSTSGHLLTHLDIEMRKYWIGDGVKLAAHLTGHNLPNLTHLTFYVTGWSPSRRVGNNTVYYSYTKSVSPVMETLQGMPKLQVFRCTGSYLEFSNFPQNLPTELSEMKEFVFNCDKLTVAGLRMILGWMKGVKKLELFLDEKTFPVVFEMAPQLEQLILLGKDGGLTEIEEKTGKMWMGPMERKKQEMEWNRRRTPRDTRESETESSGESEKEDEGWTVVNRRQPNGKKKTKPKDSTIVYLPRRPRTTRLERYGKLVDDFTVFCKLQEIKSSVRIFRTRGFKEAWTTKRDYVGVWNLIEYKI